MSEKRKKIIYVITKGNWGGAQRYVFDLATHLPKEKFDRAVAMGEGGILQEKLAGCGIRTLTLSRLRETGQAVPQIADLGVLYDLVRLFKRERLDIIHLNSSRAALLGALAVRFVSLFSLLVEPRAYRLKPKIIFTVHGWPFKEPRPLPVRMVIWAASYFTAFLATDVILVSKEDEALAKRMPGIAKKIRRIANGIAETALLSKEYAREKLAPAELRHLFWIGTIGELTANKGQRYLIEAFSRLSKNAALVVIGNGPEKKSLEEQTRALGASSRVVFADSILDAARYLQAFDVFAFPSLKEGLPYALLEAGYAGLSVVATDIPGNREIIIDEAHGILVPPQNSRKLEEALRAFIENADARKKCGVRLAQRVQREFRFETMFKKTMQLYEKEDE